MPLSADSPGRVAVWSVRNARHPIWSAATPACVTSVDFAAQSPSLLALGGYDGSLAVYDVKNRQVSSTESTVTCLHACVTSVALATQSAGCERLCRRPGIV